MSDQERKMLTKTSRKMLVKDCMRLADSIGIALLYGSPTEKEREEAERLQEAIERFDGFLYEGEE